VNVGGSAGIRSVPIPEQLYEILDKHLLRLGRRSGLIFGRSAEEPFGYHSVRDRAEQVYKAAGLVPSDLQLHECRHSYKAFLEAADIRESRVDRYMGHANHSVQARYSHQFDGKYLEDAQALSTYLRRADSRGAWSNLRRMGP
jgi:integrase